VERAFGSGCGKDKARSWLRRYVECRLREWSSEEIGTLFQHNGDKAPGSTLLDPKDQKQVADYERTLQEMYEYTYALKKIEGKDTVIKLPRSSRLGGER